MRRLVPAFVLVLLATPAWAQESSAPADRELVDRVVAVVGDTVLLLSDVHAELQQLQAAGQAIPEDEAGRALMLRQIVDTRVNDLILLSGAKAAGVQVREDEINQMVEQEIRAARQRFGGSEAEFGRALAASGMTAEQYRQMIGQQYRSRVTTERFVRQRLANAPRPIVSDAEVRQMFEAQRGMLGPRPATVGFQQILIDVKPSDAARTAALERAQQVLDELRGGGDFAVLARRFSDDPGSREQGGDLGWQRRGRMVAPFENAVWSMRPGETSPIVETDFGFHIIRLDRVRGGERQARHILIRPEVTDADEQRAYERADSIAQAARAGAPFTELVRRYPTPGENRVDQVPMDRLPPVYAEVLREASTGDVVGPFEDQGPTGSRWIVLRLSDRGEAGEWRFEDVREQVRERIQEQQMLERLLADLRRSTYVSVTL